MKTKNTKVRIKDLHHGAIIYRSHPVYGIEQIIVRGKPYVEKDIGLFCNCDTVLGNGYVIKNDSFSLNDAGITSGDSYNYRRTFKKRKQAEAWANKMRHDKGFIKWQEWHERVILETDDYDLY